MYVVLTHKHREQLMVHSYKNSSSLFGKLQNMQNGKHLLVDQQINFENFLLTYLHKFYFYNILCVYCVVRNLR